MPDQSFSLDVIQIQSPCSASWDAMEGDEVRRFCEDCQLHVHNLSEMRRRDAEALVSRVSQTGNMPGRGGAGPSGGGGRVCVQMQRGADGRVITREDRRWTRRMRRRAGVVSGRLLVGLGTAAVVLLGATGVLASRETDLMQKIQQWRPAWLPAAGQSPRVGGSLRAHPPVPGQIMMPNPAAGEDLRMGEMKAIKGDIAAPVLPVDPAEVVPDEALPAPAVMRGEVELPAHEGERAKQPVPPPVMGSPMWDGGGEGASESPHAI